MIRLSALLSFCAIIPAVSGLVMSERAQMAKGRLLEALKSPAGKLTLSPEIVIPEPSDPTAILLQTSLITTLSEEMRVKAKANAVFIRGALPALKTFCNEQEGARGNFPSPLPVIFCDKSDDMNAVAEAGAEGILISICGGENISCGSDVLSDMAWVEVCKSALEAGLQPIPEVNIQESTAENWKEEDVQELIQKITETIGEEPVSVLLSVQSTPIVVSDDEESDDEEEEEPEVALPEVPKALAKKVAILGSVRAKAGGGRMGEESSRFKAAGFTGAVLRQECIPAVSMSQDLEYLTNFWGVCIGDLKSLKSKSFNFQSRNYLEKSVPLEWMKYQKDVLDSGALGEAEDNVATDLNPDSGDYKGF